MAKINLLPKNVLKQESPFFLKIGILILIIVGLIVGSQVLNKNLISEINRLEGQRTALKEKLVQFKNKAEAHEKYKALSEKLEYKKSIMDSIMQNRQNLIKILDAIAAHLPQDAWLVELSQKEEKITIGGYAKDNETISDFLIKLENSNMFSQVKLIVAEHVEKNDNRLKKFTILCESKLI